jgi:sialidase-1
MKKILALLLIAIVNYSIVESQTGHQDINNNIGPGVQQFPGTKSTWKGFLMYAFNFHGRDCRIACPDKPAKGNPWVWNARFPDWHTEMDSILLSDGFYVTFINTNEFNGSPEGVKIWDEYFRYLTENFKLDDRVALEGISRGGLYVYNFAKKYPWRISCIYTEAPVCDIKSWPGGFGKGIASPEDWKLILKSYGFKDDDEAKAYKDNPVDNLEKLAAAKVPVLHMIGLNDSVVPPEENSYVLIDRYIRLGGVATVVPCTYGKQELNGHHFDIETPKLAADFIKANTRAFRIKLNPANYYICREGLVNSAVKFEKEKTGRIAFLGGSITYNPGWRDSIASMIKMRFPQTVFEFIKAGIPSFGSVPDAFRLNQDVIFKGRIDLLFVESAVNDRTNGYSDKAQMKAMEGIVRAARASNPKMDIIFMYFVDPDKIRDYSEGVIPQEIVNHENVAAYYNLPAVNLAKEVSERIYNKEFTWEGNFIDLHPSQFGQQVYFRSISNLLEKCWDSKNIKNNVQSDYELPPKINKFCYDKGTLIPVSKADAVNGWVFDNAWSPSDKLNTREGFVKVPMLVCSTPGKVKIFRFKGTAVGIATASGPNAGIIEYSIDNSKWNSVDLFTQWSNSVYLPWFLTLNDELNPGSHTLKMRLSSEKNQLSNGTTCILRFLYVNNAN